METNAGKLVVYQGEQFTRLIGGIDWDACDQIVLCLYKNGGTKTNFVKVADADKYPDAQLLAKSTDPALQVSCFISAELTTTLATGSYYMEAMRVIDGINAPILKSSKEFFTIKDSQIDG